MSDYVIEMLHITKEFPGIKANDDITLQLKKGEIHALLGENGAGKTTLMSVLFGMYKPETGEILEKRPGGQNQRPQRRQPPWASAWCTSISSWWTSSRCWTTSFWARRTPGSGFLKKKEARAQGAWNSASATACAVDPDAQVEDISVGMQQRVEILKMLYRDNEILIFDEPTAVLTPQEIDELMEIMRSLRPGGQVHPVHHPQAQRDHGGGRPLHGAAQGQAASARWTSADTTKEELSRHDGGPRCELRRWRRSPQSPASAC